MEELRDDEQRRQKSSDWIDLRNTDGISSVGFTCGPYRHGLRTMMIDDIRICPRAEGDAWPPWSENEEN